MIIFKWVCFTMIFMYGEIIDFLFFQFFFPHNVRKNLKKTERMKILLKYCYGTPSRRFIICLFLSTLTKFLLYFLY